MYILNFMKKGYYYLVITPRTVIFTVNVPKGKEWKINISSHWFRLCMSYEAVDSLKLLFLLIFFGHDLSPLNHVTKFLC